MHTYEVLISGKVITQDGNVQDKLTHATQTLTVLCHIDSGCLHL